MTKTDGKGSKAASSNKKQEIEKSRDRPRHERTVYMKKKFIKSAIMFVCERKTNTQREIYVRWGGGR